MAANCKHEEVTWGPVEMNYTSDGTAEIWQKGTCNDCGKEMILNYEPGTPQES